MTSNPRRVLRQHLETLRLLGIETIPAGEAPAFAEPMPAGAPDHAAAPEGAVAQRATPSGRASAAPQEGGGFAARSAGAILDDLPPAAARPAPPQAAALAPAAPPAPVTPPAPQPGPGSGSESPFAQGLPQPPVYSQRIPLAEKLAALDALDRHQVRNCARCPLHATRSETVFASGDADARVMFIGEGPGADEDTHGVPFIGRAGEMLSRQIRAMQLRRTDVYIANVVKCRPPGNRTPAIEESEACAGYLREQIRLVQPQVIIALGGPAMKFATGSEEGITRARGRWAFYRGLEADGGPAIPVMPTFHPSFILRAGDGSPFKRDVWNDLQRVMAFLAAWPRDDEPAESA